MVSRCARPYGSPDCGRPADAHGHHAVCCQRTGTIGRGHTALRDTLFEILRLAGYDVELEQRTADCAERRPADILVKNWKGRPLAIDVTVVTLTHTSAPQTSQRLVMDDAAILKARRSRALYQPKFNGEKRLHRDKVISSQSRKRIMFESIINACVWHKCIFTSVGNPTVERSNILLNFF